MATVASATAHPTLHSSTCVSLWHCESGVDCGVVYTIGKLMVSVNVSSKTIGDTGMTLMKDSWVTELASVPVPVLVPIKGKGGPGSEKPTLIYLLSE